MDRKVEINHQLKDWINKNNIPAIISFLWCNIPSSKEPYKELTEKQQNFSLFISCAYVEYLCEPHKISPMIRKVISVLIRVGFVSKRHGDINATLSTQLLQMFDFLSPEETLLFKLNDGDKANLENFLENLFLNTTNIPVNHQITDKIRRGEDFPLIKPQKQNHTIYKVTPKIKITYNDVPKLRLP